jgi:hypothetical protein
MELWQILIVVGLVLLIIFFYRGNKIQNVIDKKELFKYYNKNDINQTDVYINSILSKIMELNNYPYPIQFNPSMLPEKVTDLTNNSNQIKSIIKYLEDRFNTYDKNYTLNIVNVKKLIEHSTDKQVKYVMNLEAEFNIMDFNKKVNKYKNDIIMEIIISKYFENNQPNYEMFIGKLVIGTLNHRQEVKGVEQDLERERLDEKNILNKKKQLNQAEVNGLTADFENIYPRFSNYEAEKNDYIYNTEKLYVPESDIETFIPNPNKSYSNCEPDVVHTEDVLDIFQ